LAQWFSSPGQPADIQSAYVPMAPMTGLVMLVISACVLARLRQPSRRRVQLAADAACLAVLALAGLIFWARVEGHILGVERLLTPAASETATVPRGIMSPVTAVLFVLSSLSLLLAHPTASVGRLRHAATLATTAAVSVSGLIVVTGYAYGTPFLYGLGLIPVALITGLAFLLIGMSLWALLRDDRWPMAVLLRPSVRSRLFVIFVPLVLVAVLVGGAVQLRLLPELTNPAAGALLLATVTGLLAVVVVSLFASRIGGTADGLVRGHQMEARNAEALSAELEQRVLERTARLDVANKELEAFAYSVSHDLRAPLRHISGFSALLAERTGEQLDDQGRHYLEVISRSVHEMGVLIDDLLQFSRTGRVELKIEPVVMDAVLAEALAPLRRETEGRDIEWTIEPLPDVVADRALLRQVWVNLLGNAVKYTRGRTPARIEVGYDEIDGEVVFSVRDNGVGFDMQYAHKLFGVFQRLHNASEFEGTGIGLANVHRIVSRLGGRVWAEGELDKGATFSFSLRKWRPSDAAGDAARTMSDSERSAASADRPAAVNPCAPAACAAPRRAVPPRPPAPP
jgi:signal transduction histidine kinase